MPARELLVGPPQDFRRFAEELIATSDRIRFQMLLELVREPLVQGWERENYPSLAVLPTGSNESDLNSQFFRDEFVPAIRAIVTFGILLVKFDLHAEWLQSLIDVLIEGFEESRRHNRGGSPRSLHGIGTLPWWRPGFEIYVSLRAIATYIVLRKRVRFLPAVLRRFVIPLELDNYPTQQTPILCWPFHGLRELDFAQGRAPFYWSQTISARSSDFGGYEKYLAASCGLEFILEFNSWLCTNPLEDNAVGGFLKSALKDKTLGYTPDLFAYSLQETAPMANQFYEDIAAKKSPDARYAIVTGLFELVFDRESDALSILGAFLYYLLGWQSSWMLSNSRFPFHFYYEGRLGELVTKQKAIDEKKKIQR